MKWCTDLPANSTAPKTYDSSTTRDAILVGDIVAGTIFGYCSVYLYACIVGRSGTITPVGMMIWRELILVSVIGALVVARFDPQTQDGTWCNIGAAILGVLGRAACAGTLLLGVGMVTGTLEDLARLWLLVWAILFLVWMCLSRVALLVFRRHDFAALRRRESIALIGTRDGLGELVAQLSGSARIVNIIDRAETDARQLAEALSNVVSLARDGAIGMVVLAAGTNESPDIVGGLVDCLKVAPIRVAVCTANPVMALSERSQTIMLGGVAMTLVTDRPMSKRDMLVKMMVDRLGALLLLLLLMPILLGIALAILLETGGPIIFRQRRNGWCGQLFTVYKFRSMRHAPGQHVHYQTRREDPRCTRVGSFLRRTSLDELPQLWNVLIGDMSLVGPRPHADFMHARERMTCGPVADYVQRQRVKPGLTGWAQVHGLRGAADTPDKLRRRVEFDRYYVDNWSIWLDLKILALTPRAVLSRENAF